MKRLILILSLAMVVAFAGNAMAQCNLYYGEGYVYGQVTMYGYLGGQQGAVVYMGGGNPQDAGFGSTFSDAGGFYTLHNAFLSACGPYSSVVNAYYLQYNGGGQSNEYWAQSAPIYLQRPNQGEILSTMANLPLWFLFYF